MFVIGSMNNTLARFVNAEWSLKVAASASAKIEFLIFEIE
jgi:hypothetical protein